MKKIWLPKHRKYILLDNDVYPELSTIPWTISERGYANYRKYIDGKRARFFMHRLILKVPEGKFTDHINRNRLDNRKINLRVATLGQNAANCAKYKNNTSGFKGVVAYKTRSKLKPNKPDRYKAYIGSKPRVHMGSFKTAREAAITYNQEAMKRLGINAC